MTFISEDVDFVYDTEVNSPDSTFAHWAGYNAVDREVLFRTNNDQFLLYSDVPVEAWDAYANSDSKGNGYRSYIKGRFVYEGMGDDNVYMLAVSPRVDAEVLASSEPETSIGLADFLKTGTYVVTAQFNSLEEAMKWASYLDGNVESMSLSFNKEGK